MIVLNPAGTSFTAMSSVLLAQALRLCRRLPQKFIEPDFSRLI